MRIVALHGFTGEGADFEPLRQALPTGSDHRAPDFPGHGSRRAQRLTADYALDAHLRIIDEAVGTDEPVTLIGYSMGGRLALHWALAHPDRCRRLVLIGASPGLPLSLEREERRLADAALAGFLRAQGLTAFYKYWHHQPMFRSLWRLPPERLGTLPDRRATNDPVGLALSLESVGTGCLPSLWHRLGELRTRVDLVTGELDPKFTRLAQQMGEKIPKARLSVIEDVGHAVHLERPEDLAVLLES